MSAPPPQYGAPPPQYAGGEPGPYQTQGAPAPNPYAGAPQTTAGSPDGPYAAAPSPTGAPVAANAAWDPFADRQEKPEKFPAQPVYQDQYWIFPFAAQFIVMVILSIYFNTKSSSSSSSGSTSGGTTTTTVSNEAQNLFNAFFTLVILSIVFPIITSASSLWVMRQYAHCLVWTSMLFGCAMCLLMAIVFFSMGGGGIGIGVIFAIVFLVNCWWVYAVRGRVPFAVAVLETVVDVIRQRNATVWLSFASILVHTGWNSAWVAAATGTYQAASSTNSSTLMNITYFFLVLSYYWTSQVVSNVVMVTCAGVMAEWYFKAPNQPEKATTRALKRAVTTSFGSIIYGSFLIAIVKTLRQMANNRRGGILACIAACIMACFEAIIRTVNFWAYTYVAIYGIPYCDACRATFNLFQARGFDLIINEDLIAGVLVMMAFISGAVCAILSFVVGRYIVFGKYVSDSNYAGWTLTIYFFIIICAFIAFWLGLMFTITALVVVQAAVAALYVCYAEDPAALANTKPEIYNKLTNAFMERYRGKVAMFQ